jgi:hypothetical protein
MATIMNYVVVILQEGECGLEYARLECTTLEEAQRVRQSFVNYGKCQEVTIVEQNNEL